MYVFFAVLTHNFLFYYYSTPNVFISQTFLFLFLFYRESYKQNTCVYGFAYLHRVNTPTITCVGFSLVQRDNGSLACSWLRRPASFQVQGFPLLATDIVQCRPRSSLSWYRGLPERSWIQCPVVTLGFRFTKRVFPKLVAHWS